MATVVGKPLSAAPAGLRLLATWFDVREGEDDNPEVQTDLRHWADLIEKLVDGLVDAAIEDRIRELEA